MRRQPPVQSEFGAARSSRDGDSALRRRGKDRAALTAKCPLDFGAGEQAGKRPVAACGKKREPVQQTGKPRAVDCFFASVAVPAGNLEHRLRKRVRKTKAATRSCAGRGRRRNGEIDQIEAAEFGVD